MMTNFSLFLTYPCYVLWILCWECWFCSDEVINEIFYFFLSGWVFLWFWFEGWILRLLHGSDDGVDCVQSNVSNDDSAAWPVANPVVTCASVSDAGFPSNFVADPFLFIQVSNWFLLFFIPLYIWCALDSMN